jgi:hypothetical protein
MRRAGFSRPIPAMIGVVSREYGGKPPNRSGLIDGRAALMAERRAASGADQS